MVILTSKAIDSPVEGLDYRSAYRNAAQVRGDRGFDSKEFSIARCAEARAVAASSPRAYARWNSVMSATEALSSTVHRLPTTPRAPAAMNAALKPASPP